MDYIVGSVQCNRYAKSSRFVLVCRFFIAGILGCVSIESGVTKHTIGEAWCAFNWYQSSEFHCQWTPNQVSLLLPHMLIYNTKSIFIYVMKYESVVIWKLVINSAVWIKLIVEIRWNNPLLLAPNCYEVVAMVATSGRYGCAIVMSYTEINKFVSQWLLTFNLYVSRTLHAQPWNHWYGQGRVW